MATHARAKRVPQRVVGMLANEAKVAWAEPAKRNPEIAACVFGLKEPQGAKAKKRGGAPGVVRREA